MYEEYLGEGYHDTIRKLLQANKELLPDRIIDADLNIGAMRQILQNRLGIKYQLGQVHFDNEENFGLLQEAAKYLLAGILCSALRSRTAVPPFVKYQRNWAKKQQRMMERYERLVREIERRIETGG
jgi:hypothetical protein